MADDRRSLLLRTNRYFEPTGCVASIRMWNERNCARRMEAKVGCPILRICGRVFGGSPRVRRGDGRLQRLAS